MNAEIPISLVDITGKRNQYETLNSEKKESKIKEIDAVVDYIEKVAIEHNVEKSSEDMARTVEKQNIFGQHIERK